LVTLDNVSKRYGERVALQPVDLEIARGETTALIGPSGCGKSTLLRMIVGLVRPDTGVVTIGGEALTPKNVERLRHGIGYVIQDGGLFPHLTCAHNVALLARHLGLAKSAIDARLRELSELVNIPADALDRYPQQLSGGQRQRVGLMRALMLDPPLLLLDEPLGALDPVTRYELQTELKEIFEQLSKTVVIVTHDMGEAGFFAEDIVMMREGRVIQRGSISDLIERPADPYVSQFMRAQRVPGAQAPA
jgi:osmoprotectant transport system ATP-binding protein